MSLRIYTHTHTHTKLECATSHIAHSFLEYYGVYHFRIQKI